MEFRLLRPLKDIDGTEALERFVSGYETRFGDADGALQQMMQTLVHVSVDMTSPGLRKLALHVMDTPLEMAGWSLRGVDSPDRWDLTMILEKDGSGYVINCEIEPELTEAAEELDQKFSARKWERLDAIKDAMSPEEYAKARMETIFQADDPEEQAMRADPRSWKQISECLHVREVRCAAFGSKDGNMPAEWSVDGFSSLEEVMKTGFRKGYQPTQVFKVRPCYSFDMGWRNNPEIDISAWVANYGSALMALHVTGIFIEEAGLLDEVEKRSLERCSIQYGYIGDDQNTPIIEAGAAAVNVTGQVTLASYMDVGQFWRQTAAIDVRSGESDYDIMIRMLRDNGHTSPDNEFQCNDADDYSWLQELEDGEGILWVRGQNGQYRVDYKRDGDDVFTALKVSRCAEHEFNATEALAVTDPGYVAAFRLEEGIMVPGKFPSMTMRRIRDLNNVLFTLRSVTCCLEEDYGRGSTSSPT